MDAGGRIRRRVDQAGLQARNTQAARDALRRRQKEKKARVVKRHVRFKHKKALLQMAERTERPAPIVAAELSRDDDSDTGTTDIGKRSQKKSAHSEDTLGHSSEQSVREENDDDAMESGKEQPRSADKEAANENDAVSAVSAPVRTGRKKGYVPFMKERREFEKMQQERQERERERMVRVEEREKMLTTSKKKRNQKTKQIRKLTRRGQPKLKYRLDAMLDRIEKQ